MTQVLDTLGVATDRDLVAASRQGNQEAFARIVRRYQGMITGLIYASCGDLHRSEDVAQETFVLAWKKLPELREPQRLAAWLCQIARYRLLDQIRSTTRENARLDVVKTLPQRTPLQPDAHLLSEEEKELLWRTLANIAQPYRETLVLYYRHGQSTADVAAAMETSEEAVRQRLVRGREMMREEVAAMLERSLSRSAPSAAFTVAVVAALPALVPQTAAAAAVGAAAKGSSGAAGAGLLAALAMWLGPVLGLIGGIIGTRASLRDCKTPAERRLMIRAVVVTWGFVMFAMMALVGLFVLRKQTSISGTTFALLMAAFWIAYSVLLLALILRLNRAMLALRQQEGTAPLTPEKITQPYIVMAGMTLGAFLWMMILAARAGEFLWVIGIAIGGVVLTLQGGRYINRRNGTADAMLQWSMIFTLIVGIATLAITYWKMHAWLAKGNNISLAQAHQTFPLWAAISGVIAVFAVIEIILAFRLRCGPFFTQASAAPSSLPPTNQ